MKRIRGFLRWNSFVQDPEFTQTTVELARAFRENNIEDTDISIITCLLYTSPSPRDRQKSRMPSSA